MLDFTDIDDTGDDIDSIIYFDDCRAAIETEIDAHRCKNIELWFKQVHDHENADTVSSFLQGAAMMADDIYLQIELYFLSDMLYDQKRVYNEDR